MVTRFIRALLTCGIVMSLGVNTAEAKKPAVYTFWMGVHGGITFNSSITLTHKNSESQLAPSEEPRPLFGLYFGFRLPEHDLGLLVDNFDGGTFQGQNRTRTTGGRTRIVACASWRYMDRPWGSMALGLRPGVVLAAHSDHLRSQVAQSLGLAGTQIGEIDRFNAGFTFGAALTMTFYLTGKLNLFFEAEITSSDWKLQNQENRVEMFVVQPFFTLGLSGKL